MLSLYVHIPFCQKKCGYCSFPVIPIEKLQEPGSYAAAYKKALFRDIHQMGEKYKSEHIYTVYIGGGTPLLLGSAYLIEIIDEVLRCFDCSHLEELSIECNPYPYDETLAAVQNIIKHYASLSRVRFSFGIQSLDDDILQKSNRDNTFAGVQTFTTNLLDLKQKHVLYNYDFIAFGRTMIPDSEQDTWFRELVQSHHIDSFSLYTLELFAGAKRYHPQTDPLIAYKAPRDHKVPFTTSDDAIFGDFSSHKKILHDAGYDRYEISNYALPGKESLHNSMYRTMQPYLGLGLGAHSLFPHMERGAIGGGRKQYIDANETETLFTHTPLTVLDQEIESCFLSLRTSKGLYPLSRYTNLFFSDWEQRIQKLQEQKLALYDGDKLVLTDAGMDVHHLVCTYLMERV